MGKHVLIVFYSQSGQLKDIVQRFAEPFTAAGNHVELAEVRPVKPYTFPWTSQRFFDVFPESVLGIPAELEPLSFGRSSYDLVVMAYQPWYLSPSIPFHSLLVHPELVKRVKDTPVITLIGARNMWISAQEKVKLALGKAGARLVGNAVLTDRTPNLISAITIQYWMFTGKKDRMLGIFPNPGISGEDIASAADYGRTAAQALEQGTLHNLQEAWIAAKAVRVNDILLFVESRGAMMFRIWASVIARRKNRTLWLRIFKYYLVFALFLLSPLVIVIYMIILRPLLYGKIRRDIQRILRVN